MLLLDIADYLTSQGGWVQGGDLFVGQMPPHPDLVTVVYETGGPPPDRGMASAPGLALLTHQTIQVVVRGESFGYTAARNVAQKAFLLLDGLPERVINGTRYCWVSAIQAGPFGFGRDDQGRPLIACNYRVDKDLDSTG